MRKVFAKINMMRVEFRDDFKNGDVLIVMGSASDMRALSAGLHAWTSCPEETVVSSIMLACEGVEITLQRHDLPDAATASDSLTGVIWRIGENATHRLGNLIDQLSQHPRPAHLYLDFNGYARTVIISMDEY